MVQQKVYSALSELLPSESTAQPAENDAVDTFDGVQYGIGTVLAMGLRKWIAYALLLMFGTPATMSPW